MCVCTYFHYYYVNGTVDYLNLLYLLPNNVLLEFRFIGQFIILIKYDVPKMCYSQFK